MKYRAIANIIWEFDSELNYDQSLEIANKHLGKIPVQDDISDLRLVLRLDRIKEKTEKVQLGEFKIDEVMPFLTKEDTRKEYECDGVKYHVKMNSHRYFIFKECMKCVACGLNGTKMLLEYYPTDKSPHFNLYGEEDGKLILMTKDHIHAKAFGGEDRHSNYQTMCITCNNLKGHYNLTLENIKELRKLYSENKDKTTKRNLHLLIEETKTKMSKPWSSNAFFQDPKKFTSDAFITLCDINVYQDDSGLYGKSVYEKINPNHRHIGCIKKGICLEPLVVTKKQTMCILNSDEKNSSEQVVVLLQKNLLKSKK
jgi:HNH endonuclease